MTMICVPLMVEDHNDAIRDATLSAEHGADMVEFRVDVYFEDQVDSTDLLQDRIDRVLELVKESPLPCIVTCRPHWEGGEYHGDDDERVSMYEALGTSDHPPAYIDVELATYTRSANIRQKINLAVDHPEQKRSVSTRLILSSHDFEQRPSDLTRKILTMPACSVIKIAYQARSIRDNLELFEILSDRQKPMIALCMGEFGLMSRVLAPKFGGLLTFASLIDESKTAPGQPTIDELLNLYRFRKIDKDTKVYGIIGWPVTQSMSPLVHNAGFEKVGWNGVYLPMPVEGSYESFKATVLALNDSRLDFTGASVTIPHKQHLASMFPVHGLFSNPEGNEESANTIWFHLDQDRENGAWKRANDQPNAADTDSAAIERRISGGGKVVVVVVGTGGVARAALRAFPQIEVRIVSRDQSKADKLADTYNLDKKPMYEGIASGWTIENFPQDIANCYINCTPVGMKDGPDPSGMSIPLNKLGYLAPDTVVFDTVYNPVETPLIKYAKEQGLITIDGAEMFVSQAEMQFGFFIGDEDIFVDGIHDLFDQLVRQKLETRATRGIPGVGVP
jgi:3-dehydroquinate dehydratase/shikimate dehydrogenase